MFATVGMTPSLGTHLQSCRSLWEGLLGYLSSTSIIDMSAPQYFIYPDGILSKFLLHFFCGLWISERSKDGTDGAACT